MADFKKRLKAKVGKRARKPENLTDATFQAASLKVARQSALDQDEQKQSAKVDNSSLTSGRGRRLEELVTQLKNHPAGAVRLAAVKGLVDIAQHHQPEVIVQHISVWSSAGSKSIVDSEEDVRLAGLSLWKEILNKTKAVSTPTSVWKPFAPLIIAYLSSALNSLDKDTRKHGAVVVDLVASHIPELISFSGTFLPAYQRLLSDEVMTKRPGNNRGIKRRKTDKGQASSTLSSTLSVGANFSPILQSLVKLLQSAEIDGDDHCWLGDASTPKDYAFEDTIMRIAPGSRGAPALVVASNQHQRHLMNIRSGLPLDKLLSGSLGRFDSLSAKSPGTSPYKPLLASLRDKYIELVQGENCLKTKEDWTRLLLVTKGMRLLWEHHVPDNFHEYDTDFDSTSKKSQNFCDQCERTASILLEDFPFAENASGVEDSPPRLVNAEICLTLIIMSQKLRTSGPKNHSSWMMKAVVKYAARKRSNNEIARGSASKLLLQIVAKVLLNREYLGEVMDEATTKKALTSLASALCNEFFPENIDSSLARGEKGRFAVALIVELFRKENYSFRSIREHFGLHLVNSFESTIQYLVHWDTDFVLQTKTVLELITNSVLKLNIQRDGGNTALLERLKNDLEPVFILHESHSNSIFERLPQSLQRKVVSLVCLLGSPSDSTVEALAHICARSRLGVKGIKSMEVSLLVSTIHTMRKSIRMPKYLSFLVDATGLTGVNDEVFALDKDNRDLSTFYRISMALDEGIAHSSLCIIECGTEIVLPRLQSLFSILMEYREKHPSPLEIIRIRAVLSFLVMFLGDFEHSDSSISKILHVDFVSKIPDCAAIVLAEGERISERAVKDDFLCPVRKLLKHQHRFLTVI